MEPSLVVGCQVVGDMFVLSCLCLHMCCASSILLSNFSQLLTIVIVTNDNTNEKEVASDLSLISCGNKMSLVNDTMVVALQVQLEKLYAPCKLSASHDGMQQLRSSLFRPLHETRCDKWTYALGHTFIYLLMIGSLGVTK